jgi:carboxylesterase type B
MGQSAGAMSIQYLLCNPDYDDLYQKAILMSGAGLFPKFSLPRPHEKTQEYWKDLAEKFEGADRLDYAVVLSEQPGEDFTNDPVYIYRSEHPWGPFAERRLLFILPDKIEKKGDQNYHWLYMVNLHQTLSRTGELVFTTNTDPDDFWKNFNDEGSADYYRPFFYRVFNWKSLYGEDETTGIESTPLINDNGNGNDNPRKRRL